MTYGEVRKFGTQGSQVLHTVHHGRGCWSDNEMRQQKDDPSTFRVGLVLTSGLYFRCNPLIYIAVKSTQFVKTPNVLNMFR